MAVTRALFLFAYGSKLLDMDFETRGQIRVLQVTVLILFVAVLTLVVNLVHPFLPARFKTLEVTKLSVRDGDGTVRAVLSGAEGLHVGYRASHEVPPIAGLLFFNEEGEEEGGLVYNGGSSSKSMQANVSLTFDQYRQDQNIYLHHDEHEGGRSRSIDDGLSINSRPDYSMKDREYQIYDQIDALPAAEQGIVRARALEAGQISTRRLYLGVRRGIKSAVPYDDAGLFLKNRLGEDSIRLYVDYQNRPHFEFIDKQGTHSICGSPSSSRGPRK